MEVLAIIAYKQPITRAEIDNVRGVDSGGVIDTLTDRKFIKIVGRKETLGRPLLYGTTQEFLRHFGLSHLSELPVIEAAKDVLPNQQETVPELPFDNKGDVDSANNTVDVREIDNDKNIDNTTEQQNDSNNVTKDENILSNDIKDNNIDVVTENENNEQNNTEK
jgi:hypothetical protein